MLALVLVLAYAGAASAARTSFNPYFSAGLGEGATLTTVLDFSGTEYGGFPDPLTSLTIHVPAGTGNYGDEFPTCSQSILESHETLKCPAGSYAGATGHLEMILAFGAARVAENATAQAFFAPGNALDLFIEGTSPAEVEVLVPGTYTTDSAPYGEALDFEFPLIETVPGAPFASITHLELNLGSFREENGSPIYSVTVPDECPAGQLYWAADAQFFGESASEHTVAETPCPEASNKLTTATALTAANVAPVANEATALTATVTPSGDGSAPTGTVTFLEDGAPMTGCSSVPIVPGSSAQALCAVSFPTAGSRTVTARYSGNGEYKRSVSPPVTIYVQGTSPGGPGGNGGGGDEGPGMNGGGTTGVDANQIAALLTHQLASLGNEVRGAAALMKGRLSIAFKALTAGIATIAWYAKPRHGRAARNAKPSLVLVASATARFSAAQTRRMRLKLTKAGRSLLKRHSGRLRLTASYTFTATGLAPIEASRAFTLRR